MSRPLPIRVRRLYLIRDPDRRRALPRRGYRIDQDPGGPPDFDGEGGGPYGISWRCWLHGTASQSTIQA